MKILVIRFSSIGDIVLTSPVVRCLKQQLPGAEVHFLTKAGFAGVVRDNPYIDKVHILEDDLSRVISDLKSEKFDYIADLHHNLRSARVKTALGVKSSAFNKLNIEKWLLVNLKFNRMPSAHIVDRYMQTVASLGVKYDDGGLDYFIPEKDQIQLSDIPEPFSKGYYSFVIGAKHATKRLPDFKITEIIKHINLPVILLGGKEDLTSAEAITAQTGILVYSACGKYGLNSSASLVKQSKFVITHDTGLMHIAAALRKKIISVWGNTVPEFGMYPFLPSGEGESVIIENRNLSCRPCSKIGYDKCPKGHFKCMTETDVDQIRGQAQRLWNSSEY
jgi:ADP-heptose:LPS heptosyltransferase